LENLKLHIEALLFAAEQSIGIEEIQTCINAVFNSELSIEDIQKEIDLIQEKFNSSEHSMELREVAIGYQFLTKKEYSNTLSTLIQQREKKKLSNSALETIAIIAYKQPITKTEIEQIRGVNCDYSVQKLLEKELIVIAGKSDNPGRPILYATSKLFMDYFGLKSMKDLPQIKDISSEEISIGIPNEL
jgi:segregation and condensation protein B